MTKNYALPVKGFPFTSSQSLSAESLVWAYLLMKLGPWKFKVSINQSYKFLNLQRVAWTGY